MNRIIAATLYLVAIAATAQTLTPVTVTAAASTGLPWTLIWLGALTVALVVGFVFLQRRNPTEAAKVQAAAVAGGKEVAAAVESIFDRLAAHFDKQTAVAPVASADVPAAPVPPAGHAGVPGTFTITVTGDAAADIPAMTAKYLAP